MIEHPYPMFTFSMFCDRTPNSQAQDLQLQLHQIQHWSGKAASPEWLDSGVELLDGWMRNVVCPSKTANQTPGHMIFLV